MSNSLNRFKLACKHPFHVVTTSPWPFVLSVNILAFVISAVNYLHRYHSIFFFIFFFFCILFILFLWFEDVIFEATIQAKLTSFEQKNLRIAMILFIISEIMFFFGFFWAFFHLSLSPAIELGVIWPPLGIEVLNPWGIPFVNTLILLLSGVWATLAHHIIKSNNQYYARIASFALGIAPLLGLIFLGMQVDEYLSTTFNIADSVYGSTFFLLTGFHGFHVLIGTIFLYVMHIRQGNKAFMGRHYFGVDAAVWYWHFVDIVWLFLFIAIYWWGS